MATKFRNECTCAFITTIYLNAYNRDYGDELKVLEFSSALEYNVKNTSNSKINDYT